MSSGSAPWFSMTAAAVIAVELDRLDRQCQPAGDPPCLAKFTRAELAVRAQVCADELSQRVEVLVIPGLFELVDDVAQLIVV